MHFLIRAFMSTFTKYAFILLFLAFCKSSSAQITYDGCTDFRGMAVASVANTSIQDIAVATYMPNGAPLIIYNPAILAWVSPSTRLFFYAHECGHHMLAHGVQSQPLVREQEADCWAVQQLVNGGMFRRHDIQAVQADLARFGRGDWTHLPGPARAINLNACLRSAPDTESEPSRDSWDICYDSCQTTENRCTARCDGRSAPDACYERCQNRFDRCTDRCN